jgi:hypothetical protein
MQQEELTPEELQAQAEREGPKKEIIFRLTLPNNILLFEKCLIPETIPDNETRGYIFKKVLKNTLIEWCHAKDTERREKLLKDCNND